MMMTASMERRVDSFRILLHQGLADFIALEQQEGKEMMAGMGMRLYRRTNKRTCSGPMWQ
jgi:hypothetical protein